MINFKHLGFAFLMIISIASVSKSENHEAESIIREICMARFNAELVLSGKNVPKNMANFTCNCFLKKLNKGYSVSKSQEKCKNLAFKHFNL